MAFLLTWLAIRLGLSTEAISWVSGAVGVIGLVCLMGKSPILISAGIGLLVLFNLLDCVDGSIARVMKTENPYGKYLDSVLGDTIDFAFFPAVAITAYRHPSLLTFSSAPEDGALLWLAIGGTTGFFYILLSHVEQLFDYQIRSRQIKRQEYAASHGDKTSGALSAFMADVNEPKSKTSLRLVDRNFRVRETHYLLLVFSLLLKSVHIFLLLFLAYYVFHTVITSVVCFQRAKRFRDAKQKPFGTN